MRHGVIYLISFEVIICCHAGVSISNFHSIFKKCIIGSSFCSFSLLIIGPLRGNPRSTGFTVNLDRFIMSNIWFSDFFYSSER